jgi:hypothetical protein
MQEIKRVYHRIYADFFMGSRLSTYHDILRLALGAGYTSYSILEFWRAVKLGKLAPKCLILRHDVDTDVATAEQMWRTEMQAGCVSSYYFRLSTFAPTLMKEMHNAGFEASYHYEEIAAVAKSQGLTTVAQVQAALPMVRELFKRNLSSLRNRTALPMTTVASHGDFVNRRLGIANTIILEERSLREEMGIEIEAYDQTLMRYVCTRYADRSFPHLWDRGDPRHSFSTGEKVVYVLTHPRQWRSNRKENFLDDVGRLWQDLQYRWHSKRTIDEDPDGYSIC